MLSSKTALRLLMLGMFVSAVGTSLSSMGFFLLAAQTGRSPLLAAVLVANLLPSILLGLVGGYVADRYLREDARARYPWATLPIGVAIGVVGILQPGFWGIALFFTLGGAGNGYFNAITNRIILFAVPEAQQGRAWAGFRWVVYTCLLVGYMIGAVAGASHALLLMSVSGCTLVGCAVLNIAVRGRAGRKSG